MANYIHLGKRKRKRSRNNRLSLKNKKMEKLANIHPGEILNFEFLEPLEIQHIDFQRT